jgi:serine/threonine protein kinase
VSSSELAAAAPQTPTSFLVTSDPTVQITVYDATRTLRGQAEGSLRLLLVPGLYRVHFERGGRVDHEIVDHETGTDLRHAGPALHSPVPFVGAATSHDCYTAPAERFSVLDTAPPLGPGPHDSRLFVFVRRAARDGSPRRLPSELVTVHDADGRELTAITADNAEIDHAAGYVAYSCRATPGTYRLRAARSQRDAAIVVPAGRAAQVFVADTGSLRLAELRLALVPAGARFNPRSLIWGAMEGVIAALRVPDRPLPLAARVMLPDAIDDDLCFGLAAAHVLWRSGDRPGLAAAMRHLARYREIPDVAILDRLEAGSACAQEPLRRSPAGLPDTPPLLRASLTLAMTRPELDPGTLSAYSAFAHAARTAVHDSVWCTWSTRTWDERWIEPAVERLREHDCRRDAAAIARSLALATETVEQALEAIDATVPSVVGKPLDARDLVVPGYVLGPLLGRGARSAVYRARRQADGRDVALKIVPVLGGADGCARAHDELDRCPPADHPQLLAATARGPLPGDTGIWLEIELCDGSVLDRLSEDDAPLALPEAHRLVLDALAVLAHLHGRGIAHGDLKPSNLLLCGDRSVAIAGPGLAARRAIPAEPRHATDAPRLAPPELLRSDEPPTPASDIWAMAAMYYFLLTLEYPRDEYADQSQLEAALDNPIVSIARRRPGLPPELVQCIDAALSPIREARPRDAGAFRQRLAAIDPAALAADAANDAPGRGVEDDPIARPAADAHIAPPRHDVTKVQKRGPIRSLLAAAHTFRGRVSIPMAAVTAAIIGLLVWSIMHPASYSCEQDPQFSDLRHRSEACLASYQQTGNEHDLALAGNAHLALGELDRADQLARQLLAGSRRGDAYAILGHIALKRNAVGDATTYATLASASHISLNDEQGLIEDAMLLFQAAWRAPNLTAALNAADEAIGLARRLRDPHAETIALFARADVLRELGNVRGAEAALRTASGVATEPCDHAWSQLKHGMCLIEAGNEGLAMASLVAAEETNRACRDRGIADSVALNEAWLLRRQDPAGASARLDAVARSSGERPESLLLRGCLAADRGDLAEAERHLERAEQLAPDASWTWRIVQARAELSELRGGKEDDLLAELSYRRAITAIAAVRATTRAHSSYFISSHRGPYDGLIALFARHDRWNDALSVLLELGPAASQAGRYHDAIDIFHRLPQTYPTYGRGSGMLNLPSQGDVPVAHFAFHTDPDATHVWFAHDSALPARTSPGLQSGDPAAAAPAPPSVTEVVSAWRARDLVIVIAPSRRQIGSGRERAYRIRIAHGEVSGEDIGDANRVTQLATALFEHPADREAARALGAMMIPAGAEAGALHVLASGALGRAPLAALRDATGSLIVARRPLTRVLALRAVRPRPVASGRSVIIGDPLGNLPGAAVERAIVAKTVGPSALVAGAGTSVAATRSLLWTAGDAELLHVAGPIFALGGSRALRLADGTVEPAEIVQRGVAPRIAVLTGCNGAAMDDEVTGSLASALLEAGTEIVIATDHSVEDAAALSLMTKFYAQPDWRTDPARALARVQAAMDAKSGASTNDANVGSWAGFGALGRPPLVGPRPTGEGTP